MTIEHISNAPFMLEAACIEVAREIIEGKSNQEYEIQKQQAIRETIDKLKGRKKGGKV